MVCVSGHYHCNYGVEKVIWYDEADKLANNLDDVKESVIDKTSDAQYDFTNLKTRKQTVFINAAWMTMDKREVEKRNKPIIINLKYPLSN